MLTVIIVIIMFEKKPLLNVCMNVTSNNLYYEIVRKEQSKFHSNLLSSLLETVVTTYRLAREKQTSLFTCIPHVSM